MLEGVRGRRIGIAIFFALIIAFVLVTAQRLAEQQFRGAGTEASTLALSMDPVSVAD